MVSDTISLPFCRSERTTLHVFTCICSLCLGNIFLLCTNIVSVKFCYLSMVLLSEFEGEGVTAGEGGCEFGLVGLQGVVKCMVAAVAVLSGGDSAVCLSVVCV